MNNLLYIKDTLPNKISYFHLLLFTACLPFDRFYAELVLISFGIHTLIQTRSVHWRLLPVKSMLQLQLLFLSGILCLTYTHHTAAGINQLGKQMALLLFPVLFAITTIDTSRYKKQLLQGFSITCLCTVIYLYADAVRTIIVTGLPVTALTGKAFMNHNFSQPINLHATYLSMYVCLSLTYQLQQLLVCRQHRYRFLHLIACGVLMAGLIQLASAAVLVASFIIISCTGILLLNTTRKKNIYVLISFPVLLIVFAVIYTVPSFRTRFFGHFQQELTAKAYAPVIPEPRAARWQSALQLIKQKPLTGYGSGSETQVLKEQFYRDGLYISYYDELNTHNQYLSIAIEYGCLVLLLFISVLLSGFITAFRRKDALFTGFLLIISITSLSENILSVNKGIFFFSFFYSLFLIPANTQKHA